MILDLNNILEAFHSFFKSHEGDGQDDEVTFDVMSVLSETDLYMYDF
jgi:hypothetical protein